MFHDASTITSLQTLIAIVTHEKIAAALRRLAQTEDLATAANLFDRIHSDIVDAMAQEQTLCRAADRAEWARCVHHLRDYYRSHINAAQPSYQAVDLPVRK